MAGLHGGQVDERLERRAGLPLRLAQISNRGAKVYPSALAAEAHPSDCLRLRFKAAGRGALAEAAVLDLLARVGEVAPWMHVEKLSEFDGKPAYSKDQGED